MLQPAVLIPPSASFWHAAASALLQAAAPGELQAMRVVVATFAQAQLLRQALARQIGGTFIPPHITTLSAWAAQLPPQAGAAAVAVPSERLMTLYAGLRQHAWLKKLFTARRNTDLLPLAQTLLALSDELTQNLLPAMRRAPGSAQARWNAALQQLSPGARDLLSDEAQLVWTIWQSQLDGSDAAVARFDALMRMAAQAARPLAWIGPVAPDPFEQAFLERYAATQPVLPIMLDWRAAALDPTYAAAWSEVAEDEAGALPVATPPGLALAPAPSLEAEAVAGAQTIVDWLQAGKTSIAIIAQDRVASRRIRALLERAQVFVADETGWKLSTTRAAAVLAAWFEVVSSRAETVGLLDFLKSPFVLANLPDKAAQVMAIEVALRRANVLGGWDAVADALDAAPPAQQSVRRIARQAGVFTGRKTLAQWSADTAAVLHALGIGEALNADAAGVQVMQLLYTIAEHCEHVGEQFSASEWRAFVSLQLESTDFAPPKLDQRVMMLPLNGARLRSFDAVLMVGADAEHLPSQPTETLFFANAVRRELGLMTRESRQRQQLRDFIELLSANREVVLSWQQARNGEPNPLSSWIERLQLALSRAGLAPLRLHASAVPQCELAAAPAAMPAPSAAALRPAKLSASGFNSLVACPYQFFATRMLGLSGLDELSDMPEKRDYGDWLHQILSQFHETLRDHGSADRLALLEQISQQVFAPSLERSGAALGYLVRWKKAMPAYLSWLQEWEAKGWRFAGGEQQFEQVLHWPGGQVTLHGRVDRIDRDDDGRQVVLDYKTRTRAALRERVKQGEDQQLPFYGLLAEGVIDGAAYVALELSGDKTGDAEAPDYAQWQRILHDAIAQTMQAIGQGAGLPATGVESTCQYCDVRGLCRKGSW